MHGFMFPTCFVFINAVPNAVPGLEIFVLFSSLNPIHSHNDLPRYLDESHEHLAGEEVEGQRGERVTWWTLVSIVASAHQDKD